MRVVRHLSAGPIAALSAVLTIAGAAGAAEKPAAQNPANVQERLVSFHRG